MHDYLCEHIYTNYFKYFYLYDNCYIILTEQKQSRVKLHTKLLMHNSQVLHFSAPHLG